MRLKADAAGRIPHGREPPDADHAPPVQLASLAPIPLHLAGLAPSFLQSLALEPVDRLGDRRIRAGVDRASAGPVVLTVVATASIPTD